MVSASPAKHAVGLAKHFQFKPGRLDVGRLQNLNHEPHGGTQKSRLET